MIEFDCSLARKDFALSAAFASRAPVTALFGPSGSGKTTVLRLLAGLERPARGRIAVGGQVFTDTAGGVHVPAYKRRAALVFQDAQLFPHLTIAQNLRYASGFLKDDAPILDFDTVVQVLGIAPLLDRSPRKLSGGERQRVAIGRALLASPRLLLFDEPLASLDMALKLDILALIETVRDVFKVPIVYVSHSSEEVARLASTVVRLAGGRVTGIGAPGEILAPDASSLAADRFQAVSILTGKILRIDADFGVTILDHPAGRIVVPFAAKPGDTDLNVAIHSTNVTLSLRPPDAMSVRTVLEGCLEDVVSAGGPFALATVRLRGGDVIKAYLTRLAASELKLKRGMQLFVLAKTVAMDERGVRSVTPS